MGDTVEYYINDFGEQMVDVEGDVEKGPTFTARRWASLRKIDGEWFFTATGDPYGLFRRPDVYVYDLLKRNGFYNVKEG